jgi:hypothetical protein
LLRQRSQLQKRLAQVERKIVEIGGLTGEGRAQRRVRKRPKNSRTLLVAVIDVLGQHKKGLTLRDLADKLLASGYRTSSTNFQNTLYQCLYHNSNKLAHDAKTHTYRIK